MFDTSMTLYFHLGFFPLFFLIASYPSIFTVSRHVFPTNRWNTLAKDINVERIRSIHLSRYILLKDLEPLFTFPLQNGRGSEINKRFPIFRKFSFYKFDISPICVLRIVRKANFYTKRITSLYIS